VDCEGNRKKKVSWDIQGLIEPNNKVNISMQSHFNVREGQWVLLSQTHVACPVQEKEVHETFNDDVLVW
jgi:hypothetical protein